MNQFPEQRHSSRKIQDSNQVTDNQMKAVEDILSDQIHRDKTPGLQYYYFNQDDILYSYAGGFSDIEKRHKVGDETTFHAYSVTKTFTALAVLQLTERGLLGLDKPVAEYTPGFPYPENITVRHLLTHTAGIPNPMPLNWEHLEDEHNTFDYKDYFIEIIRKHCKVKRLPNEKFSYSNLGYVLLGILIEEVSGQSYADYVHENIIEKLDIRPEQLAFTIPDPFLHSKGYQKRMSITNLVLGLVIDKSKMMDKREGRWISARNAYVNGISYGGLIGTGSAFVSYLQELLRPGNKLISDEYKSQLFTEHKTSNGKLTGMCLGWFTGALNGHRYFAHAGGGFYYCEIRIYPDLGTGSVIMFNRSGMTDVRFLDRVDRYFIDQD
jgi:CubicO group peptidase (beta-lactamase class C family)